MNNTIIAVKAEGYRESYFLDWVYSRTNPRRLDDSEEIQIARFTQNLMAARRFPADEAHRVRESNVFLQTIALLPGDVQVGLREVAA